MHIVLLPHLDKEIQAGHVQEGLDRERSRVIWQQDLLHLIG
jgi:hypothetical protein